MKKKLKIWDLQRQHLTFLLVEVQKNLGIDFISFMLFVSTDADAGVQWEGTFCTDCEELWLLASNYVLTQSQGTWK